MLKTRLFRAARILILIAVSLLPALISKAQEKNLAYTIRRSGNTIGNMIVKEIRKGNKISVNVQSYIKLSFIFSYTAKGIEEAQYDNGTMVYSSVYQNLNGSEKVNKQIRYVNDTYIIHSNAKDEKLGNIKIHYNLVCIYNHEPPDAVSIFSDKYQRFLAIHKLGEHHYKIQFPDGSSNEYWFENGVCQKIKIDHNLYSAVMELNK